MKITSDLAHRFAARPLRTVCLSAAGLTALLAQSQAWALLPIDHWEQANGAKVWLIHSPSLPMVDVNVLFDAGERRVPAHQAGLAQATASLLTLGSKASGNAPARNEDQLEDAWADLGANFSASASNDALSFSLRSLTDPALLHAATALAAQQIAHPAWPAAVWQRERQRWIAGIEQARTRPGAVAGEAFAQAVYGQHPYGHITTAATLAHISVKDMQAFYREWVKPCQAYVTVVGDVDRTQASQLVETLLAGLPAQTSCPAAPSVSEVQPLTKAQEIDIPFPSEQTTVLIGQPGIKRDDPDFFAMLVGNHILGGGGFTSRLMHEVREKRGLVYGVNSNFSPSRHAGAFTISLQTRNAQAEQALALSREVLRDFVKEGPTDEELQAAKDNLIGGFALRIDSNAKLLSNLTNIAWNDLPANYLDTWTDKVNALTKADIRAAMARHLDPSKMVTVVVGQPPAPQKAAAQSAGAAAQP